MELEISFLQAGVIAAALGPSVLQWVRQGRIDLLTPPTIFGATIILGFVFPVAGFLDGTDPFFRDNPIQLINPQQLIAHALMLVIACALCFHAGYWFQVRNIDPHASSKGAPPPWNPAAFRTLAVGYTTIAVGAFAVGVALIGGPSVLIAGFTDRLRLMAGLNYLFQSINLLVVVCLLWWYSIFRFNKSLSSTRLWIYVIFSAFMVSLQGSKFVLMMLLLCFALLYHHLRKPINSVAVAGSAAVAFLLLAGYGLYTREYLVIGQVSSIDAFDLDGLATLSQHEYGGNFIQLQTLCVLLDRMPKELPYSYGSAITSLLSLPVPRTLWAEKPLTDTGLFTVAFWPDRWKYDGMTLPPGLLGDFYMNLGIPGAMIGLFLYGTILGWFQARASGPGSSPLRMIVYAIIVSTIPHYLRGEFASATAWALIYILPTVAALKFVQASTEPRPVIGLRPAR
jgi:hypothetical protein